MTLEMMLTRTEQRRQRRLSEGAGKAANAPYRRASVCARVLSEK